MHNHNGGNNKSILWMMIPCLLLLGVLSFSGDKLASTGYFLLILIGICVIPHIWTMFKGHEGHNDNDMEDKSNDMAKQPETKNENNKHKDGGCCH